MELSEKIQKLRKEQNLTQEQLAEKLFVSRTAVSKWETGRGVPNVESLRLLAKVFRVSLDELLSTEEAVEIAEQARKEDGKGFAVKMNGFLDLMALLSLLLPLYKAEAGGFYYSVPLYQLGGWQEILFFIAPFVMAVCGGISILLLKRERETWIPAVNAVGTAVHIMAILLLIMCGHPYPAVLFFFLFAMKGVLWGKNRR